MFLKVGDNASEVVIEAVKDLNARAFRQQASLFVITCSTTKRVLVVRRSKDDQVGLPCGKIDGDEIPLEAAIRELYEETGVKASRFDFATRYIAAVQFEGTLVHIFQNSIESEEDIGAAPGFEHETIPQWFDVTDLVKLPSRFRSFNIVALHKAGLC